MPQRNHGPIPPEFSPSSGETRIPASAWGAGARPIEEVLSTAGKKADDVAATVGKELQSMAQNLRRS